MKIKYKIIVPVLVAVTITSCRIPKNTAIQKISAIPKTFTASSVKDSSIASLSFKTFFNDEKLISLITNVLDHNLDNKIAEHQIKIAEAYLRSSKAAMVPKLDIGANASGTRFGKYTIDGVGNFDTNLSSNINKDQKINTSFSPNYFLGLHTSWEVDLWGKLQNKKKAAQHRFIASQHGKDLLSAALVTQTAILYFELITLDNEVTIINRNIKYQEEALRMVSVQKEMGTATELAVQQFKAQLMNTKAVLYDIEQQLAANEFNLLALMGKYEGQIERKDKIDIYSVKNLLNYGHPNQLLQNRPDVLASYYELEATHADAKAARAAFFPSLTISAFGGYNAFNATTLFRPTSIAYQLLGDLVAPVFNRQQIKSNFSIANTQQEIAFLKYQQSVTNAFHEANTVLKFMENNDRIMAAKNEEVEALTKGVEISNDLYKTAYASYIEIISAQKSKLTADLDLIKTQRNQMLAIIQLYKSLGGGWR